jgi:hypothetical protein
MTGRGIRANRSARSWSISSAAWLRIYLPTRSADSLTVWLVSYSLTFATLGDSQGGSPKGTFGEGVLKGTSGEVEDFAVSPALEKHFTKIAQSFASAVLSISGGAWSRRTLARTLSSAELRKVWRSFVPRHLPEYCAPTAPPQTNPRSPMTKYPEGFFLRITLPKTADAFKFPTILAVRSILPAQFQQQTSRWPSALASERLHVYVAILSLARPLTFRVDRAGSKCASPEVQHVRNLLVDDVTNTFSTLSLDPRVCLGTYFCSLRANASPYHRCGLASRGPTAHRELDKVRQPRQF